MIAAQIEEYAKSRGFHPHSTARWLGWRPEAAAALYRLAVSLKMGESHLRDFMDWLEEISLRDSRPIDAILDQKPILDIETAPRLGRADKLKRIKEEIRRLRYPRLAWAEDRVRERIRSLKLDRRIELAAAPGLEGGELHVAFRASSQEEFKALAAALLDAASKEPIQEAFTCLSGRAPAGSD